MLLGLALALAGPARGFATGNLLSLTIDPATLRQTTDKATSRPTATVVLQDPAPAVFVCVLRSDESPKISFPTIIFRKGDRKATCVGTVQWKNVLRARRIRISAYNADAPDRKMTFTVMLIPSDESPATEQPGTPSN